MMQPKTPQQLAQAIEALVAAYVDDARRLAQLALDQAFGRTAAAASRPSRTSGRPRSDADLVGKRRSRQKMTEMQEKLVVLVAARPGISMPEIVEEMGMPMSSMRRPLVALRADGRVRSVGERNLTRYFPGLGRRSKTADE
jgi:hypothetical protein